MKQVYLVNRERLYGEDQGVLYRVGVFSTAHKAHLAALIEVKHPAYPGMANNTRDTIDIYVLPLDEAETSPHFAQWYVEPLNSQLYCQSLGHGWAATPSTRRQV